MLNNNNNNDSKHVYIAPKCPAARAQKRTKPDSLTIIMKQGQTVVEIRTLSLFDVEIQL